MDLKIVYSRRYGKGTINNIEYERPNIKIDIKFNDRAVTFSFSHAFGVDLYFDESCKLLDVYKDINKMTNILKIYGRTGKNILEAAKNAITNAYLKEKILNKENVELIKKVENENVIENNVNKVIIPYDPFFIIEGKCLDKEQVECSKFIGNQLVIAGAGAGKTLSIVGKIKYLLEEKHVNPSEILVLAFTDKVVHELIDRVGKITDKKIDILTFHKLGMKVFNSIKNYREIDDKTLYSMVKKIMYEEHLYADKQLATMIYNFSTDNLNNETLVTDEQIKELLEVVNKVTLNGEKTNSVSALVACNLLYVNNIDYEYVVVDRYSHYIRIDNKFTIHFTKSFTNMENFYCLKGVELEDIPAKMSHILKSINKPIASYRHYKDYLYSARTAKRHEELFEGILQASRIASAADAYNEDFDYLIKNYCQYDKESKLFINILKRIREVMYILLKDINKTDFEYMINGPIDILKKQKCLSYKYIIVDEYQDISPARYNLLVEILRQNNGYLMAYGDDWQSIYSFSGSNNKFFMDFCKKLDNAKEFKLKNTYRNSQELIKTSADFVMKNPCQKEKDIISNKSLEQPIVCLEYKVSNVDSLIYALDYIKGITNNKRTKLMVLGRTNYSIDSLMNIPEVQFIEKDANDNNIYRFNNYDNIDILFLTIHRSKGLEADYVFVTEVNEKMMPLATFNEKNFMKIINKLNEYEEEKEHEKYEGLPNSEERRLFYVALTRSKNHVFLSIPNNEHIKPSIFVKDIKDKNNKYIEVNEVNSIYNVPLGNKCSTCGGLVREVRKKGKAYKFCENKCKNY